MNEIDVSLEAVHTHTHTRVLLEKKNFGAKEEVESTEM